MNAPQAPAVSAIVIRAVPLTSGASCDSSSVITGAAPACGCRNIEATVEARTHAHHVQLLPSPKAPLADVRSWEERQDAPLDDEDGHCVVITGNPGPHPRGCQACRHELRTCVGRKAPAADPLEERDRCPLVR